MMDGNVGDPADGRVRNEASVAAIRAAVRVVSLEHRTILGQLAHGDTRNTKRYVELGQVIAHLVTALRQAQALTEEIPPPLFTSRG